MLQELKTLLQEELKLDKEIIELISCNTNDEMLCVAHKMRAKVEAVKDLNFDVLKLIQDDERKNNDRGGSNGSSGKVHS